MKSEIVFKDKIGRKKGKLLEEEKDIKVILNNWGKIINEYIKNVPDDIPYKYNERASVGFLAAAIWKSKGVCIEEYVSKKGKIIGQNETSQKNGRVDLWYKIKKIEWIVEAKYIKHRIAKQHIYELTNKINDKLYEAEVQVNESINLDKIEGISVVFYTPIFIGSYSKIIDNLSKVKEKIFNKELKCSFYSYLEYTIDEKTINEEVEYYPITFIIGRFFRQK